MLQCVINFQYNHKWFPPWSLRIFLCSGTRHRIVWYMYTCISKAVGSSEVSVYFCQTTRHHIPADTNSPTTKCHKNLFRGCLVFTCRMTWQSWQAHFCNLLVVNTPKVQALLLQWISQKIFLLIHSLQFTTYNFPHHFEDFPVSGINAICIESLNLNSDSPLITVNRAKW
jgi:hypothetical protein